MFGLAARKRRKQYSAVFWKFSVGSTPQQKFGKSGGDHCCVASENARAAMVDLIPERRVFREGIADVGDCVIRGAARVVVVDLVGCLSDRVIFPVLLVLGLLPESYECCSGHLVRLELVELLWVHVSPVDVHVCEICLPVLVRW